VDPRIIRESHDVIRSPDAARAPRA